jgi:tungstate transport system ATP-binding protein
MLEVQGLHKSYNGRQVLNVDELTIRRGEILALIGPNGAGKSTLLRTLHFLEPFDQGEILYKGRKVGFPIDLKTRRKIAMVFQRPVLFNGTVRDNIAYGLRVRGHYERKRVDAALEQFDLLSIAKEHARNISGGELQRVAIAQALVVEPELIFFDEPTANLDPFNAALIEDIIQSELRGRELTAVIVSHHVSQAVRIADQVAVIYSGEILERVASSRFLSEARDPRTQAYLEGTAVANT